MGSTDLTTILEPLVAERAELDRQEADLMLKVNKLRDEKKRIEKVLRAAGLIENNYAQGKRGNGTNIYPPSDQQVDQVTEAIKRLYDEEDFTVNSLDKQVAGIGKEKIQGSIDILRQQGMVRMKGKARGGGRLYRMVS